MDPVEPLVPLGPYQDMSTGRLYENVSTGAKMLGIPVCTFWNWVKAGRTPFGFKLDVRDAPYEQYDKTGKPRLQRSAKTTRWVVSEESLQALKELLDRHPPVPGRPRARYRHLCKECSVHTPSV
jgi:hypothetical protein